MIMIYIFTYHRDHVKKLAFLAEISAKGEEGWPPGPYTAKKNAILFSVSEFSGFKNL